MSDDRADDPDRRPAWMDEVERARQERLKLYAAHKSHGSLSIYYQMFPDEKDAWPARQRRPDGDRGHER